MEPSDDRHTNYSMTQCVSGVGDSAQRGTNAAKSVATWWFRPVTIQPMLGARTIDSNAPMQRRNVKITRGYLEKTFQSILGERNSFDFLAKTASTTSAPLTPPAERVMYQENMRLEEEMYHAIQEAIYFESRKNPDRISDTLTGSAQKTHRLNRAAFREKYAAHVKKWAIIGRRIGTARTSGLNSFPSLAHYYRPIKLTSIPLDIKRSLKQIRSAHKKGAVLAPFSIFFR